MSKKHQRPNPQLGVQADHRARGALHVSNVLIFIRRRRRAIALVSRRSRTAAGAVFKSNKEWSTPSKVRPVTSKHMAARLKQIYKEKLVPELKAKLELKNTMQVPRILRSRSYGRGRGGGRQEIMDAATPIWPRSRVRSLQ